MKPRLLIVISSLCAEGTPVLTLDLCRRWKDLGIEPIVMTLATTPDDLEPEFVREGIVLHKPALSEMGRGRYLQMARAVWDIGRRQQPDAMLSMLFGWHAFLALGARLARIPTVAAHVGNHPAPQFALRKSKFRWLVQAGRPVTSKLICCSSYVQQGVIERFGVSAAETAVIYNGVEVDAIECRANAARAVVPARNALTIGMVARYEVHKDQPTLIRAARILRDAGIATEVWLVGDGSRRAEYERLIDELELADSVKLVGVRRDIPELLGQLDVFAFSTTPDEGQGVALVEAMAAAVPIVASDVGACSEVLESGRLGVLVSPGSPEALAAGIERLTANRRATMEQVASAREKARTTFSLDAMAQNYARVLGLSH